MKIFNRYLSLLLAIIMCITALPITSMAADATGLDYFVKRNTYKSGTFTDVSKDDWFYDNVKAAYELGLMLGRGDNIFDIESGVTIAETITIAARLHSIYYLGSDEFEASDPWYKSYVDYALANGIVTDSYSDYNAPATRADFAIILVNALPSNALEEINQVAANAIPDVSSQDECGTAVYKLYRAGIMIGNDEAGTFAPDSEIKRSEVAAIVTRMADVSLRQSVRLGNEYTVAFNMNSRGKQIADQKVVEGYSAEMPENPSVLGYVFKGWFTQKNGGTEFDFSAPIYADTTIYARWEMDPIWLAILNGWFSRDHEEEQPGDEDVTYTVTFMPNGDGVVGMPENQKVAAGECVVEPSEPTREGYKFLGWLMSYDGTEKYVFSNHVTSDTILYALWSKQSGNTNTIYEFDSSHVQIDTVECKIYVDNIILAFVKDGLTSREKEELATKVNGIIVGSLEEVSNILQIRVDVKTLSELETLAAKLMESENVYFATYDVPITDSAFEVNYSDSDPWGGSIFNPNKWDENNPWGNNWAYEAIQAHSAWENYGDYLNDVVVGVYDNGFNMNHEDLASKMIWIKSAGENIEESNHGTSVAGIIGASNNDIGMCGVSYNADIVCVDATNVKSNVSIVDVFDKIISRAPIVNISMGYHFYDENKYTQSSIYKQIPGISYEEYVEIHENLAKDSGELFANYIANVILAGFDPLFIQAAGNGINNAYKIPFDAKLNGYFSSCTEEIASNAEKEHGLTSGTIKSHIIIVTSISDEYNSNTNAYELISGANRGTVVDICAPGENIYTTHSNGKYTAEFGGTSGAAPLVTGVAALVKSINPSLSAAEIKELLCFETSATGVGYDSQFGNCSYPLVNAYLSAQKAYQTVCDKTYLTGHIVDTETRQGIERATITLLHDKLDVKELTFNTDNKGQVSEFFESAVRYNKAKISADKYISKTIDISYDYLNNTYALGLVELEKEIMHTLFGQVTDGTSALSGVTIAITSTTDSTVQFSPVTTGDDGTYSVSVPDGTYTLTFTKDKYQTQTKSGVVVNGGNVTVPTVVMLLTEVNFTITHTYNDVTTDIIAASPIEMHNGTGYQTWTINSSHDWTVTKSGDWFTLDKTSGSAGTTTIKISMSDKTANRDDGSLTFTVGEETYTVNIYRTSLQSVSGTVVVNNPAALEIEAIDVHITGTENAFFTLFIGITDTYLTEDFAVTIPDGEYNITLYAKDCTVSPTYDFSVNGNSVDLGTLTFDISKKDEIVLSGKIVDATENGEHYGEVIEGVTVEVFDSTGASVGTATSGSDGMYIFTFTATGTYKATYTKAGYQTVTVDSFIVAEDTPSIGVITMVEETAITVYGYLVDANTKEYITDYVNAFHVFRWGEDSRYLGERQDTSWNPDVEGGTKITVSTPDKYLVIVCLDGYTPISQIINIMGGQDRVLFEVSPSETLTDYGSFCGWMIDDNTRKPLPGVLVEMEGTNSEYFSTTTDQNGIFIIPVTVDSRYTVKFSKPGYCTHIYETGISLSGWVGYLGHFLYPDESSGKCGENATWTLDDEGVLTISGFGDTFDYGTVSGVHDQPWYDQRSKIEKIVISDSITGLGWYNFPDCDNLKEVIIGKSLSNLGKGTFVSCDALEKIVLPDSITFIGWDVFYQCNNLSEVTLSNNLMHLGYHAFYGCTSLERITIPSTVTEIGKNCFKGCTNLKEVYFYGSTPTFVSGEFHDTHPELVLYYVAGKSGWSSPTWSAPDGTVYNTATFGQ